MSGALRVYGRARVRREVGEMNSLEKRYSLHLESRRLAGEIDGWSYEAEKLRLADRTFYSPDFRVVLPAGEIEFHETKGGLMLEAANVKLKVAAALHPYRFFLVRWVSKEKRWDAREVGA